MDLANRIRSARKAKGMTQEELARRAGVGLNIVNRIERGVVTDPHYSTLSGLAAALNTSISRLVEEPDLVGKAEAPRGTGQAEGDPGARVIHFGSLAEAAAEVNKVLSAYSIRVGEPLAKMEIITHSDGTTDLVITDQAEDKSPTKSGKRISSSRSRAKKRRKAKNGGA